MKMSYLYNLDYGTFIAIIIALAFLLYFSAYVHHHHDNIATKKMISSPIKWFCWWNQVSWWTSFPGPGPAINAVQGLGMGLLHDYISHVQYSKNLSSLQRIIF